MQPASDSPEGVRPSEGGPPDPEFDWMLGPVLHALGRRAEQEPVRSALSASQQRFLQMAGRVDLHVHTRAQQESRRDAQDRMRIAQLQQEFAALDEPVPVLMDRAVHSVLALLQADGCSLDLIEDGVLVSTAACGLLRDSVGRRANMAISLAAKVLQKGRVMTSDDTLVDDRLDRTRAIQEGVRSMIIAPLRSGETMVGVLRAVYTQPNSVYDRAVGNLQLLGETLGVTVDRQRMHAQLRAAADQYRLLFERNPQPMFVAELRTQMILAANQAAVAQYGYAESELLALSVRSLQPGHDSVDDPVLAAPAYDRLRQRHQRKDGTVLDVELSGTTIDFNGRAARLVRCHDITARLRAETELARVSRAQAMLSACNECMVRASSETALLQELCRITVEIGGYAMAWVGFARDDAARTVEPVVSVGDHGGYIGSLPLSWDPDTVAGQGPVGMTIRSGQLIFVPDMASDAACQRWADSALAHGFRGLVCLPLADGERTFGLLHLYTAEWTAPGADEVALLTALADDLAYGLMSLRAREQQRLAQQAQQRVQQAMFKVAAAVSASTGTAFFEQLARNMADALGAPCAWIATWDPQREAAGQTLGAVLSGQVCRDLVTPAAVRARALQGQSEAWVVAGQAAQDLASVPALAQLQAQSYAGQSLLDADQRVVGVLVVVFTEPQEQMDVLASTLRIFAVRVAAELDRRKADERIVRQASLLDKARDAIVVSDLAGRVRYWNKSAERLYGWSAADASGQAVATLLFEDVDMAAQAQAELLHSGEWSGEVPRRRKQGAPVWVEARWTLVRDEHGAPQSVLMIDTDITQRKQAEAKIQKLAFYDGLTGLPNRQLLQERLHKALASSVRHRSGGALLCLDLDNFKTLNDTLGHDKGDMLLQQVAMRLVSCVREVDTVARLGGDEFVIVLEELSGLPAQVAQQAGRVGEKILQALAKPYQFDGYEHQSSASIGVARFGADTVSAGDLLKQADIAMYEAKAAGRHTLRFFDPALQAAVTARAALESDLRQAFVQREFFLQYQPLVDGDSRVTGVEALLRWQHALRGPVSPLDFIPVAEETGMILMLGHRVLKMACAQLAAWQHKPFAELTMAVNVSVRQFRHIDFVRQVRSVLEQTGADPQRLTLELTESVLVDDMQAIVAKMGALKDLGVRFALDDFGTGYSSLTYLKKLPLDQLKIDKSFVHDVLTDPNDSAIARTVIRLAQSLGLNVIAEGVESAAQRDFLAAEGCQAFQGYYFSPPLAPDALDRMLRSPAQGRS
jgi:diguanylate cyclase (GGDEF)-like protein/PAS domain S-box-containing protein